MARRVEVGAHVVRGHDVLRVHAVLGLALDVFHFEGRIVGPERRAFVKGLRQVVERHGASVAYSAEPARSSARVKARLVRTRAGWRREEAEAGMSLGASVSRLAAR